MKKIELYLKKSIPFSIKLFFRKIVWRIFYIKFILQNIIQVRKLRERVFCPISEQTFLGFAPMYFKYNQDLETHQQPSISPNNGAREGLRLQWLYLKNKTDFFHAQNKLLHFAPEYSFFVEIIKLKNIHYFPVDKFGEKYDRRTKYADIEQLIYENNSFDYIICNHVLEHVDDDIKSISEMYRVLKPGGMAVITVPIDEKRELTHEDVAIINPKDREREFGQWDHTRIYALDLVDRLESPGFKVERVDYAKSFSGSDYDRYGLTDEPIFIATKPV